MTADPVTAAVLAEALREAYPYILTAGNYYQALHSETIQKIYLDKLYIADDTRAKVKGILDRYDAQRREGIEREIRSNTAERREMMRYARERVNPAHTMFCVLTARHANHRILTLRRQLRELERHTNGTH